MIVTASYIAITLIALGVLILHFCCKHKKRDHSQSENNLLIKSISIMMAPE